MKYDNNMRRSNEIETTTKDARISNQHYFIEV